MENFSDTTKHYIAIEICQQRRLHVGGSQPLRDGCKVVKINLDGHRDVTGSLSSRFSELPDLQVLILGRTKVSGDIEALKNLPKLTKLNLSGTQVSGNIEALKNLKELKELSLGSSKLSGNIAALENLTKLESLDLTMTKVSGDIEALKNLTKLTALLLGFTPVSGDLLALKNLTKLKSLFFSMTKVSGSLAALENLTELQLLYLHYTNVIGDMSSLRSTSLEDNFDIKGTKITCEDAALRAVLRSLGLQAEQLTDLKNFEGVTRMLSCRNMKVFLICFLHTIWRIKLDHAWPE